MTTKQILEAMSPRALATMIAKAQRLALTEWQTSKQTPGLAARFTKPAHIFYQFDNRSARYLARKDKKGKPDYVYSGALQRQLMARKVKTSRLGGAVVSRLAFGGGVLNVLKSKHPSTITKTHAIVSATYPASQVTAHSRRGAPVRGHARKGYVTRRRATKVHRSSRGIDYATPFGDLSRDDAFIRLRYQEHLRELAGIAFQRQQRAAARTRGAANASV
jgi:hypothetical protein